MAHWSMGINNDDMLGCRWQWQKLQRSYKENVLGGIETSPEVPKTTWDKQLSTTIQEEIYPVAVQRSGGWL